MSLHLRKRDILVLFICLATTLAACTPANEDRGPIRIDPDQLEMFVDEFFAEQMEELHIPGLTFVFVQDGEVLLAKGYGWADLEEGIPFDAEETVVRVGSVSKLFVATAVMQLVERGELDLHADVNRYLTTFQLDESYPEPVTLAHLLTHTAGFEDPPYSTTTDPTEVQPLGSYLAEHMPPRVSPPGEVFRYCNHGYALAAHVVEQVAGIPFDQYVGDNILDPLGMERSGYLLSPPMPDGLAVGYFYENGGQIPQPIDYDDDYPGGSLVSTAADMAKFMFAQLQDGCYQDTCILQPLTIAEMQQEQFTMRPGEGGTTYGFAEGFKNGQRLIGHSGTIRGFGNILELLPEHDLGYFFSFNEECFQTSACDIIPTFRQQFLNRFFPSGPRIPLLDRLESVWSPNLSVEPTHTPTSLPKETPMPTTTPTTSPSQEPASGRLVLREINGPVYSLAWSPDGKVLASAGYRQVKLWDVSTSQALAELEGHSSYVWGIAWLPDGSVLASANQDGTVRLWDVETYQELSVLNTGWAFSVAWSPSGNQLAVGTAEGPVQVWDIEARELLYSLENPSSSMIISVAWSPDGRTIASGELAGGIYLWDAERREQRSALVGYTDRRSDANGLAWSPDGRVLASAHQDGQVRLWDPENGELLQALSGHVGWVRGVAWSPDGRSLASTGQDAKVYLWNADTGEQLALRDEHTLPVWSVAWSPDGRQLAAGSGQYGDFHTSGTVVVWPLSLPEE